MILFMGGGGTSSIANLKTKMIGMIKRQMYCNYTGANNPPFFTSWSGGQRS